MRAVAGSRIRRGAGGGGGVLRRARGGRAGARPAHRAQRAPRALVRRRASSSIALWSLLLVAAAGAVRARWVLRADRRRSRRRPGNGRWRSAARSSLLLPATAAMGATLPAMERVTRAAGTARGDRIAALYASNTLGAVLGVLASRSGWCPRSGSSRTAAVCVALNLLCARRRRWPCSRRRRRRRRSAPAARAARRARRAACGSPLTGLLGIGYEVLVVRVLSQVTEDTVYTFAMLLAVYLVGSAAGAAALPALARRARQRRRRWATACSPRWPPLACSARRACGPPSD